VTLAVGATTATWAPLRGVIRGGGEHELAVAVRVTRDPDPDQLDGDKGLARRAGRPATAEAAAATPAPLLQRLQQVIDSGSSCTSWPDSQSDGESSTTMSGSTPWFSIAHCESRS